MPSLRPLNSRLASFAFAALLALVTAALAAGCASKKSAEPVAPPAGSRENGVLSLKREDNNRTAELRVGERFKVSLPENPSTGYTWAIDETDRHLLALEGTAYDEPDEGGFVGARGRRIFTFSTQQAGEVVLRLKYWRFWDGDASTTERYAVSLKIAPP
ncbi:MAG: protease inhibitor I42 family protein [Candidatus Competibacteraceae bacterium]|nr:protease inhibitor I42 family protein [Candidatus Competibacteraceae bacterium]